MKQAIRILCGAIASGALAACASGPVTGGPQIVHSVTAEKAVSRSNARWKALLEKRYSDAYEYLSPPSRQRISRDDYAEAMQRMRYTSANVERAECDESLCVVQASVTVLVFVKGVGDRMQTVPVEERWIAQDGDLWLIRR